MRPCAASGLTLDAPGVADAPLVSVALGVEIAVGAELAEVGRAVAEALSDAEALGFAAALSSPAGGRSVLRTTIAATAARATAPMNAAGASVVPRRRATVTWSTRRARESDMKSSSKRRSRSLMVQPPRDRAGDARARD